MIEVEVEADAWSALPEVEAIVSRAAEAALGAVEGDLVVLLTDDAAVRELNVRFRGKDRSTNVLSFPAPENASPHLGLISNHSFSILESKNHNLTFGIRILDFPRRSSCYLDSKLDSNFEF